MPWDRVTQYGDETPALVGIVTRKKDWGLIQTEHWYRIPVKSAPDGLSQIKYLAFYLTKALGEGRWSVSHYAEVKRLSQVKRLELLPDEPRHKRAAEPYYKIDIGALRSLPNPIPSRRWRRLVFIPTSLERLRRAQEINDLFRTSPIEDRLYAAMKDVGLPAERQYLVRERTGHMLDLALFCHDGNLDIECDGEHYHSGRGKAIEDRTRDNDLTSGGWRILRFSGSEINHDPGSCLELVRRTIRRLGGVAKARRKAKEIDV